MKGKAVLVAVIAWIALTVALTLVEIFAGLDPDVARVGFRWLLVPAAAIGFLWHRRQDPEPTERSVEP